MNWPYVHTLINHFPIILTVVGCAVLVFALISSRRAVWLYALATLALAGLSVYPAFLTGDEAEDAMRNTWYVARDMVEAHDDAAGLAMFALLAMGAASAYAWWRMLRRERAGLPPVWLRLSVLVLATAGLITVTYTAYLGGRIVHESPKLATPPATLPS